MFWSWILVITSWVYFLFVYILGFHCTTMNKIRVALWDETIDRQWSLDDFWPPILNLFIPWLFICMESHHYLHSSTKYYVWKCKLLVQFNYNIRNEKLAFLFPEICFALRPCVVISPLLFSYLCFGPWIVVLSKNHLHWVIFNSFFCKDT